MKKKLASIALTAVLMVSFAVNAFAAIESVDEIDSKIDGLTQISNLDFTRFVNKSDLIGDRLQNFNMATAQYQNAAFVTQETLKSIISQIEILNSSSDISTTERTMQINKLYQDADTALYNMDSKTIQYLYSIRSLMPTLTYQKFSKKYKDFYNDLNISNSKFLSK